MDKARTQLLLVIGGQRTGTSLLASMLGGHSEVNMLMESETKDVLKLTGKRYQGNKLIAHRQIRFTDRASRWGFFMNRLVNFHLFGRKFQHVRPFPTSRMSIADYKRFDAEIVVIRRNDEDTLKSILKRTVMSKAKAERELVKTNAMLDELVKQGALEISYEELVEKPEESLTRLCKQLGLDFEPKMLNATKYNLIYPREKVEA